VRAGRHENPHVFPVLEIDLSTTPADQLGLYTNLIKHDIPETPTYRCPAPLDEAMTMMIKRLTIEVFHAVGALDVGRVIFGLTGTTASHTSWRSTRCLG